MAILLCLGAIALFLEFSDGIRISRKSAGQSCEDFGGAFYCTTSPGCYGGTVITQEGCDIQMSNPAQGWSGTAGVIVGQTVTVWAWGGMTGTLANGVIAWTNSAKWVRSQPAPERCYVDPVFTAEEVSVRKAIQYRSVFNPKLQRNETLTMDVYEPPLAAPEPQPAVVVIHGGSFVGGNSESEMLLATALAQRGFVVASINYRLTGSYWGVEEYCCPGNLSDQYIHDAVSDGEAAVRFVKAQAKAWNVDPDRIAIAGSSAGAVTVLHMAYNSSLSAENSVKAVVANSGELRYIAFCQGVDSSGEAYGCVRGVWDNRHALDGDQSGRPPLCLVHGTNDTVVPYTEAVDAQARANRSGLENVLIRVDGAGHVPTNYLLGLHSETLMRFLQGALSLTQLPCPQRLP